MRIGVDVRAVQVTPVLRGVARYTLNVVEGLVRHAPAHEPVLVTVPGLPLLEPLERLRREAGLRAAELPTPLLYDDPPLVARVPRLWRLRDPRLRRAEAGRLARLARAERLDVLHLPSVFEWRFFPHPAHPTGGTAVVKTVHDLIPLLFPADFFGPGQLRRERHYRAQAAALGDADLLLAVSASARDDVVRHLAIPAERVVVVPNVVADAPPPSSESAEAARRRLGVRAPYFLYCSGGGPNKNRDRLVRAFAAFHASRDGREPVQLVIAGPDDAGDVGALKALAFDHGLSPTELRFTGFVSDEDLAALYAGARALVSPSLYEGFGLPVAQAMQAGVPVLASDRSSHPEVVGDAGLLVDPTDVAAITAALHRLADDAQLRATLGARGRARARAYAMDVQTRALVEAYERARSVAASG